MAETTLVRIKKYIDFKGVNVRVFEQSVGMSNGSFASQLKNGRTIGVVKLENILHIYTDVNPEWLLTGKGDMLKSGDTYNNVSEAVAYSSDKGIPLVEPVVVGGFGNS